MRATTLILVVSCLLACLPVSLAMAAADSSIDLLRDESTGPVRVRVDPATGAIEKVLGRFRPASSDRPRAAHVFLERHAGLLRVPPDLAGLTLARRSDDAGGSVVQYAQHHRGTPVLDGSIVVGLDPRGDIIHVDNGYVPDLDVPARPILSAGEAVAASEAALGTTLKAPRRVSLVIVKGDKGWPGHFLAWEVAAVLQRPRGDWRIFVDSQTGAVVRISNLIKSAGPTCVPADPLTDGDAGLVFTLSPVDALNDPTLTDSSNVDSALSGCKLGNLTSTTDLTGAYVTTSLTAPPRAAPPYSALRSVNERAVDEATAYYHVNRSKEYLNFLGFPGVMNFSIGVDAADGSLGENSHYVPSTKSIGFGTHGVDDAQDPDIVYHEVMHAIQDDQIPGFGQSFEASALGEGTADYWGAALTDDGQVLGGACLGAWMAVAFSPYTGPGTGCVRRLDGAEHYPRDLTFGVHGDGEIYSAALWGLRQVLGGDVLDRLVIKSHTFLQPAAGFLDAADALLSADLALYGGAHAGAINDALKSHAIPRTGAPASPEGLTSVQAVSCETAHPYNAGDYKECRFTVPGATRLRVHFASFATEAGWDPVLISDADYRQVQSLSGAPFASTAEALSAAVNGDTIVIRFKADLSITEAGFAIDEVQYANSSTGYSFTGFFAPVDNAPTLNVMNAGAAVPVKFSLGGDQGLAVLAAGYPKSHTVSCSTGDPTDVVETTTNAGASSLQYDALSDRYTYVWKTEKAWKGTCRQLDLTLADSTSHIANFRFK